MLLYPAVIFTTSGPLFNPTGWALVPMNRAANADEGGRLEDDGTFYLPVGRYIVLGSVTGNTNGVQASIAPIFQNPLTLDVQATLLSSVASLNGACIFSGTVDVPDDGSGGALLGVYQAVGPGLSNFSVAAGLPEVYASLLFLRHSCVQPPLEFTVSQEFPASNKPLQVPIKAWSPLFLNIVKSPNNGPAPPGVFISATTGKSFHVPAGTYVVSGLVMSNLYGAVCALAVLDPEKTYPIDNLLLESFGGCTGNCEFLGVVVVPDDGSGGSDLVVLGYPLTRGFGAQIFSELDCIYVTLGFSRVDGALRAAPCSPFTPLPDFFSVYQALPSGNNPPLLQFSGSTYAHLPLTLASGAPPVRGKEVALVPSLLNGSFRLPQGTWIVRGGACGSGGRQPTGALLAIVDSPDAPALNVDNVLVQATNAFGDNMEIIGIVEAPAPKWVGLFVSYNAGQRYGFNINSGLPEIYSQVSFIRKV